MQLNKSSARSLRDETGKEVVETRIWPSRTHGFLVVLRLCWVSTATVADHDLSFDRSFAQGGEKKWLEYWSWMSPREVRLNFGLLSLFARSLGHWIRYSYWGIASTSSIPPPHRCFLVFYEENSFLTCEVMNQARIHYTFSFIKYHSPFFWITNINVPNFSSSLKLVKSLSVFECLRATLYFWRIYKAQCPIVSKYIEAC